MTKVPKEQLDLRFFPSSFMSEDAFSEEAASKAKVAEGATVLQFRSPRARATPPEGVVDRAALIVRILNRVSRF
jgi:hypothetical protein